jgi:hypothetical protein
LAVVANTDGLAPGEKFADDLVLQAKTIAVYYVVHIDTLQGVESFSAARRDVELGEERKQL